MVQQIFVNLPVKDLERTKKFWIDLGFSFNSQFTDEKAGALVLKEDHIYAMLVTEPFYQTFIAQKKIADSSQVSEVINAVSVESREAVDNLVDKALEVGASKYKEADDYGWMYSRSFADPDGHYWEILYMDSSKAPANPGEEA